jgi:amino acid permease
MAFRKCGVAFTTFIMILSALSTYASLTMLCISSRRGGGSSYGEVVRSAFGSNVEVCVSLTLFVFLSFVIVAYMVLIRDIWTPLTRMAFGSDDVNGDAVLLIIIVVMMPFLVQRSLHALRWNCYVGFASIFVLCVALIVGGWNRRHVHRHRGIHDEAENYIDANDDGRFDDVEYLKMPSASDAMFAFPIVMLSFLCHFNVIPIQNALRRPTRQRMRCLLRRGIFATFVLMYAFGFGGYYYAGNETMGNILLNVPTSRLRRQRTGAVGEYEDSDDEYDDVHDAVEYYLFLLGRIGCGTTLMLAMPLMALPCREALLEVVYVWVHRSHRAGSNAGDIAVDDDGRGTTAGEGEERGRPWRLFRRWRNKYDAVGDAASIDVDDEVVEIALDSSPFGTTGRLSSSTVLIRRLPIQGDSVFRNPLAHYGTTLLIVTACYVGAVAVSGVAVVWSFIGSSMAFFISFMLPCGSYIIIENAVPSFDRWCASVRLAWTMLVVSIVGAAVCTINSIRGFG